ncbi:flagellar hook assembly protein FlgD [Insolitispirillum peregrinum]|uniref:flagellar hook assembly protein FlgD n=1 Tax=Insolitispirillum peregrinum TaxID=80876 RepID=UPI00362180CC
MPSVTGAQESVALGNAYTQSTSSGRNKLANDMNTFLTMLTTQLKNQDPLSPMDSNEFTNQLVQFAQVEQQIAQNEKLDSLVTVGKGSQASMAVQYIGMNIEAESSKMPLQDGAGRFAYGLKADAKSVGIMITDSAGKTVYTTSGLTTAGVHDFKWDGKDADGNQLDDGIYNISVTALDKDGASIDTWTTVFGTVDGVTAQNGETMLVMGKVGVALSDVLSVTPKKEVASTGTATGTDASSTDSDSPDSSSS